MLTREQVTRAKESANNCFDMIMVDDAFDDLKPAQRDIFFAELIRRQAEYITERWSF